MSAVVKPEAVPQAYLGTLKPGMAATLPVVSWESVSWDSVSWDSVSWDSVSWDSVSWGS